MAAHAYAETGKMSTTSGSLKSVLQLGATASVAPLLYEFTISTSGTPADNVLEWVLARFTASASATSFTPVSVTLDPGIVTPIAALAWAAENASVEGTVTAASELFDQGINQRAAYRWVASPGYGFQAPAVASNGLVMRVLSTAYTGQSDTTFNHME